LGRAVKAPEVIALYGGLGAGKTCFTKGVARGLGLSGAVTSPTYSLIQEYPGVETLIHVDCYRLGGTEDALNIGLAEELKRDAVVVVEWADRIEPLLPERRLDIRMEIVDEETRLIYAKER
jgi:tRNA threonylcarbamoyladenosine biosynthesis protein TsaE